MAGNLVGGFAVGKGAVIQDRWDNGMLLALPPMRLAHKRFDI
jgi:hypothetical protein